MHRLQLVQNTVAKAPGRVRKWDRTTHITQALHWLQFNQEPSLKFCSDMEGTTSNSNLDFYHRYQNIKVLAEANLVVSFD